MLYVHENAADDVPERRLYKSMLGIQKSSDAWVPGLAGGADIVARQAQVSSSYSSN